MTKGGGTSSRDDNDEHGDDDRSADAAAQSNLSKVTVQRALAGNGAILAMKMYVWNKTGATVAAVESLHSFGDVCVQGLLLYALTRMIGTDRSERSRTRGRHHFGVGRMAFSFGLMGAIGIFWVEGVTSLLLSVMRGYGGYELAEAAGSAAWPWIWGVLAASAAIEAGVLAATLRDVARTKKDGEPLRAFLARVRDPFVKTVLYEDAYALVGVACAALGMGCALHVGHWWPDTAFAVLDGGLLCLVAYRLLRFYYPFLLGRTAGERTGGIKRVLERTDGIAAHTRDQSLWISPDEMFYKASIDFDSRNVATMLQAQARAAADAEQDGAGAGAGAEQHASGADFVEWRRRWRAGELDDAGARRELHVLLGRYAEGVSRVHEGIVREAEREIRHHYPGCVFIDLEPEIRTGKQQLKAQQQQAAAAAAAASAVGRRR